MNHIPSWAGPATALALILALPAYAQTASTAPDTSEVVVLDPITLLTRWFTTLGSGETGDSGSTVIGIDSVKVRSDDSGDPNTALKTLPTVQYRNDTDDDAGENVDDVLDLRPLEVSISGARVDENNFMIDGVGINSLGSSDNPFELSAGSLSRETGSPNLYAIYGSHSQTQYVPESMVESVEVLDSNVSAQYGGFQGGVVNYQLTKPDTRKASGSASISYQDDSFTRYHIGTEDGTNPNDVAKPQWKKLRYAFDVNQPVSEKTALLFGYSRSYADGLKDKDAQYLSGTVRSESRSDFYRIGVTHDATIGKFGLMLNVTDYSQQWDSNYSKDMQIRTDNLSKSLTGTFTREIGTLSVLGVDARNVKLDLSATYQNNKSGNDYNSNIAYNWIQRVNSTDWEASFMDDWCQSVISGTASTVCREGGYGDRWFNDERLEATAKLTGDIWAGNFSTGMTVSHARVQRTYEGFTLYTVGSAATLSGKSFSAFTCADGDATCNSEEYASTRSQLDGYSMDVEATKLESWLELDQKWGDFALRAGMRLDYNDVLENWDLAPRLVGTWNATESLTLTLGANRYYSDNWIGYAIHDNTKYPVSSTRTANSTTGVVGDWVESTTRRSYSYLGSGLDTPYTDEVTLAAAYKDGWTDGTWRARYIHRDGKDQFARSEDSTTTVNTLTNNGWSKYDSFVLEYQKVWDMPSGSRLQNLGLYISGAWANRQISNNSYYGSDGTSGEEEHYWYNNKSYSLSEFAVTTGNMDIPVRSTIELRGAWDDGKYELGVGADVAFGYTGVIDTDETVIATNADGYTGEHYVYEDHKFDAAVSLNLSAKIRLARIRQNDLDLSIKVANLLDDVGNRTSTSSNPWMAGRSFAMSMNYTW